MAYSLDRNYETYLALDLAKYAGKWIAVLENKVIASGSDFKEVFEKTKKKYPNKKPLFDWVSDAAHHFLKWRKPQGFRQTWCKAPSR